MIRLENVSYESGGGMVEDISFHLHRGETAVIMGPKGSGKTDFWQVCVGMRPPISGEVFLIGESIYTGAGEVADWFPQKVGIISQQMTLLDNLTVLANIGLPLSYHMGLTQPEMRQRAMPVLEKFGLAPVAEKFPHEISDIDTKMTMMARAAISGQTLLVLDEPTAGDIDPVSFMKIVDSINRFRSEGMSLLITTTSPSLASMKGAACYYLLDCTLIPHSSVMETRDPLVIEYFSQIRNYTERQSREIGEFYKSILYSWKNAQ